MIYFTNLWFIYSSLESDQSDQFERLADADDWGNDTHHPDPCGLSCGFVDVVMSHEDVENVANNLHRLTLQDLWPAVHVHHVSLVLSLHENDSYLCQVSQNSKHVLQKIGPKTARVVHGNRILTDDFKLTEEDAVIEEEEDQSAKILQYCEQL